MVLRSMTRAGLALGQCCLLLSLSASAQPRLTESVVHPPGMENGALFVHSGVSQSHFPFVVALLARSAQVPVGFEEVAQEPQEYDGNLAKVPTEDRTTLVGLTIGRALDALVAADPRYAWREQDGVLIIRPAGS